MLLKLHISRIKDQLNGMEGGESRSLLSLPTNQPAIHSSIHPGRSDAPLSWYYIQVFGRSLREDEKEIKGRKDDEKNTDSMVAKSRRMS